MNEDEERIKNLTWFGEMKLIMQNLVDENFDVDEAIEDIYQITKEKFKK
jgi:hypothetical protein